MHKLSTLSLLFLCGLVRIQASVAVPSLRKQKVNPHLMHGDVDPRRTLSRGGLELVPLYPGLGAHFAYLWVGTPPQPQAVLIDTATAWTVFPCVGGCKDCGKHINSYFKPKQSTTYKEDECKGSKRCIIRNEYSTVQWSAYTATDTSFMAGNDIEDVTGAQDYKFNLTFGCMVSANDEMQKQAANGILGMGMSSFTLPFQYTKAVGKDNVFSLCLREGGGILTLGGVDTDVQDFDSGLKYTPAARNATSVSDFWTVEVQKLKFRNASNGNFVNVGKPTDMKYFMSGKGTIIDSGSSQSYLPIGLKGPLTRAFKTLTGISLSDKPVKLSSRQYKDLPSLVFTFKKVGSNTSFDVSMSKSEYVEKIDDDNYRIMLSASEENGAVLGANFLRGKNVVFDLKNKRIGFAKASCRYADFHESPGEPAPDTKSQYSCDVLKPVSECTATCQTSTPTNKNYLAKGTQYWESDCDDVPRESRECHVPCSPENAEIVFSENLQCPIEPWSECSKKCVQSRTEHKWHKGKCEAGLKMERKCYASQCPTAAGDYLLFVDLKLYTLTPWSPAVSEDFFNAMAAMFPGMVQASNVEVLVDSGAYTGFKKIQIQIRIRAKSYHESSLALVTGEDIIDRVNERTFLADLISALNSTSYKQDYVDYSRFGWLIPGYDIVLLSATGFPVVSRDRNPDYVVDKPESINYDSSSEVEEQMRLLLTGVVLASLVVICGVCCFYCRLKRQYLDLEREKGIPGNLKGMWERFKAQKKFGRPESGSYKLVRSTELTQNVGSLDYDKEDEFAAALDMNDDVNG